MKNQKGFVTAEFMFAIIIATCLTIMTFALTLTLSTVETVQYFVFSAARAQAAGNISEAAQKAVAKDHYNKLIKNKTFAPLFSNGWFTADLNARSIRAGNGDNFKSDYDANRDTGQGVQVLFHAHLLELKMPLLGNVEDPNNQGFQAKIAALLIREISQAECYKYMEDRAQALKAFHPSQAPFATPWEDNGC